MVCYDQVCFERTPWALQLQPGAQYKWTRANVAVRKTLVSVGSGKFWGMRRIFARIFPNLALHTNLRSRYERIQPGLYRTDFQEISCPIGLNKIWAGRVYLKIQFNPDSVLNCRIRLDHDPETGSCWTLADVRQLWLMWLELIFLFILHMHSIKFR